MTEMSNQIMREALAELDKREIEDWEKHNDEIASIEVSEKFERSMRQLFKGKDSKNRRRKIRHILLATAASFVAVFVLLFAFNDSVRGFCMQITRFHQASPNEENDLFPSKPVDDEGFEDNSFVQINNELVNAVNDYVEGKITYQEYEEICKKLREKMDELGSDELEQAEKEYHKAIEKKEKDSKKKNSKKEGE